MKKKRTNAICWTSMSDEAGLKAIKVSGKKTLNAFDTSMIRHRKY